MSTKKPKDPHAPKKNQSSYFIFSNERRSILQAENKDKKITEISKLISAEWKVISSESKTDYERKAAEAKKKYIEQFDEYKKTDNFRVFQEKLARWKENEKDLGRGRGKKGKAPKKPKQPTAMPKRPQTSYFIFSNERRNQLKESYPDKKITELSTLISTEWNAKGDEDKKIYQEKAQINKDRYSKNIAIYKETDEYKEYAIILDTYRQEKKQWDKSGGMDIDDSDDDGPLKVSMPRKPKDKQCPKRPLTSYFIYAQEVREKTKSEFPTKQITELAKEISKKWKVLTEDDKIPYNEKAAKLKEVYKKNIENYKGSDSAKEFAVKLESWKEECNKRKKEARAKQLKKAGNKKKTSSPKKTSSSSKKKKSNKKTSKMKDSDSDDSSSDDSSSDDDSSDDSSSGDSSSDSSSGSDSDSSSE